MHDGRWLHDTQSQSSLSDSTILCCQAISLQPFIASMQSIRMRLCCSGSARQRNNIASATRKYLHRQQPLQAQHKHQHQLLQPHHPCQLPPKRSFWSFSPTEEIANTGSIARDILATERTFLAWSRTGLGFVGAGSALAAAYHREHAALAPSIMPASAFLIGNGAFLLLFATRRYWLVIAALRRDKFPVHTVGTLLAVFVTSVNTVTALAIVARAELAETAVATTTTTATTATATERQK
jgi:uncharacterized membrane protein YidH (DUF202 family)